MGSVKVLALAGAAVVSMIPAALAADLPPIIQRPMQVMEQQEGFASGWYLRGDIGITSQKVDSLYNDLYTTADTVTNLAKSFDSSPLFGIGLGYRFNDWIRFDVTGEYRSKATFRGLDVYTPEPGSPTGVGADDYYASKSETVVMANLYLELGSWANIRPFIGAGVGAAYNKISNFRDINVPTGGVAYADSDGKWNLAWAVHAGLAYDVTPGFTVELAYRYLNLGDAQSGDLITYNGISTVVNPMYFRDIDSHDVKLGVRWMLQEPSRPYPLMRKG